MVRINAVVNIIAQGRTSVHQRRIEYAGVFICEWLSGGVWGVGEGREDLHFSQKLSYLVMVAG